MGIKNIYIYIYIPLLTSNLVAQTKGYPVYKNVDPNLAAQVEALTAAGRAQQSRRALDTTAGIQKSNLNSIVQRPLDPNDPTDTNDSDVLTLTIPVYRDGYRVTGSGMANYSQWAPGSYFGFAQQEDWGGQMVVPFWNPDKANFQLGPDAGVQQAVTFWWPNLTPQGLPGVPDSKPYFTKATYGHGRNTVSNFRTYWKGAFNRSLGTFWGQPVPELDVLNNSHNEGGNDHPNMAMVSGFPTQKYQSGVLIQWTENHGGMWWPSPGPCNLASMELWDSNRIGYGAVPFTFEVECISDVQDSGEIEIPIPALNDLWGQNRVVEGISLSSPVRFEKYTKVTYVSRRVRPEQLKGRSEETFIAQESSRMSKRAVEWPSFKADEALVPHNMGAAVFVKATTRLVR